ncbi:hypothetical protein TIN4_56 [Tsukamurella phage TIN4]|uniref:Uncharacterized protein n=2 Tax=Tinduovirus TIN3 TaxID=1982571 RepID=A0A0K0N6B6_9CAUD|nr:hypothetical protein AVT54_gp069 [Tsukamurella phage TIN3]YP_009604186.1 hypothetical protein FDH87_gp069 [Tsukamurella phage TIN4]AKJ71853.1 hypothetical protein TIN3_56 [Tsukamurella phage TIN3]AKJ71962.1 hypothetical protein TIN4_56 [Tsukamurella phage TIN4]
MSSNSFSEDLIEPEVNLPAREFMFTLDQIALMLDVSRKSLEDNFLFFHGRSAGSRRGRLIAVNIATPEMKPVWRVSETAFKVWMRYKGIVFTEQRSVRIATKRPVKKRG